ncbi:cell division-specific peptidoglycan biosynthesis regulator FtsW [Desulfocicer vacuolatum DSM 3385]|uniref:Probable peptidoglycan glycosyltransferase FtsW n=1 Tax=Desulfocicer vacuolatum DSM 3385 TaxID=1121400 RepID=A0A1W1YIF2_9BACT|nr:putative lipid II flippase FtsW [Desulfocicer vacuolatum]SMC35591.1 cell division-specific peptidoglycan biosynthesis regulator FtsW [Desulfocicer vacuolatum DSM 3385]
MITKNNITAPFSREPAILIPVLIITGLGIAMVYSASADISVAKHNTSMYYAGRQAIFLLLGLVVMYVGALFPHEHFKKLVYPILGTALILMVGVLTPLGAGAGGACRWITVKGLTFQPSELLKLGLVLYLAYSLSTKQENIRSFCIGFLPHLLLLTVLTALLVFQRDLGSIVIIGFITWTMMFIAGVPMLQLSTVIPLGAAVFYFFVYNEPYRWERVRFFMDPWQDPLNAGYQLTHSLKAFGAGGVLGKGLGLGFQTVHYLPKPHTDFIFSVIGEELGLVGVLATLVLYILILKRGAVIARTAHTVFGSFLAAGITIHLGLQVVINTGVTLGVLPTKGLPLPFISYGGTSLVVSMAAMGVLMNIGRTGTEIPREKHATPQDQSTIPPVSITATDRPYSDPVLPTTKHENPSNLAKISYKKGKAIVQTY